MWLVSHYLVSKNSPLWCKILACERVNERTMNSKPSYGYLVREHLQYSTKKSEQVGKSSENCMTVFTGVSHLSS